MSHHPIVTCVCYDHPLLHKGVHLTVAREHAPAAGLCDGGQSGRHGVSLDLREPLRTHVTLEPSAHLPSHRVPTTVWASGCLQACGPPTAPLLATPTDGFCNRRLSFSPVSPTLMLQGIPLALSCCSIFSSKPGAFSLPRPCVLLRMEKSVYSGKWQDPLSHWSNFLCSGRHFGDSQSCSGAWIFPGVWEDGIPISGSPYLC